MFETHSFQALTCAAVMPLYGVPMGSELAGSERFLYRPGSLIVAPATWAFFGGGRGFAMGLLGPSGSYFQLRTRSC
ncbi:hypothetical protein A9K58_12250 [Stenotrophomonas maltophilia]|uniref:Uncharacterized protein n=1 Tax=Stenotrophomonas maltophilia TaxID=40324 RepID=A0A1A6XSI4_STEMA|nr:hypothetical protein A9K58_12250 [Stenotrophomonas maltophilia]